MNWGFPVAWLSIAPHYTKTDVEVIAAMLVGALWYVRPGLPE